MRILGVDFGAKRVGLAVSDAMGLTAQSLETLSYRDRKSFLEDLSRVCQDHAVREVVIGIPINMDGSLGPKAREVLELVPEVERKIQVPVKTWDERLTSLQAQRLMVEQGLSRRRQKAQSDSLAAILILQSYLESKRIGQAKEGASS